MENKISLRIAAVKNYATIRAAKGIGAEAFQAAETARALGASDKQLRAALKAVRA